MSSSFFASKFAQLALNFEAKKEELISNNQAIVQQIALKSALEKGLDDCCQQFRILNPQLQSLQNQFVTVAKELEDILDTLGRRLEGYFHCPIKDIPRAIEMIAFGHGSAGMMAAMG